MSDVLLKHLLRTFLTHGFPELITSDSAPQFVFSPCNTTSKSPFILAPSQRRSGVFQPAFGKNYPRGTY